MSKRQLFYAPSDLFETGLSTRAKLVLLYLAKLSDRQGVSFPAIPTIAEACGCCQNSARRALRELEAAGFISITPTKMTTNRGKVRWTSHRYTLLSLPQKNEVPAPQPVQEGTSTNEAQRYPKELIQSVPEGHSQSVYETDHDPDPKADEGLERILSQVHLELFFDRAFARSVEHALKRMYFSPSITVKGSVIPQRAVREAMELLTVDHIDFVEDRLHNGVAEVTWGEGFLMSCLYNAPFDCMAKSRCG